MAELCFTEGMGIEEKAYVLVNHLLIQDEVQKWKHVMKTELVQSQYSVDKTKILGSVKRTVIDMYCVAMQEAAKASQNHLKEKVADGCILPGIRTTDGCDLDVVRAARERWDKVTNVELKPHGNDLAKSPRAQIVKSFMPARFLYDGLDLLQSLQAIKSPNEACERIGTSANFWNSIQLQLYTSTFSEYRRVFSELAPGCRQIGLDEHFLAHGSEFFAEKHRVGDLVLAQKNGLMARHFSKTGCPVGLRSYIWRHILSVSITAQDRSYFEYLQKQVMQWTYLTDEMYLLDLHQTLGCSDYFVFRDHLESVVMAFTRDTFVVKHAVRVNGIVKCSLPLEEKLLPNLDREPEIVATEYRVPPNGVLPFKGFAMYVAPLSYLYADPIEFYYVFREMYIRYWCKLNVICPEPASILTLCKLFEDLVARSNPAVFFHLLNVGVKPLDIAFPWIQSAFSSLLDIDQVLLLWDRVIGYDSMDVLAVLAAALFDFRANELELVNTLEDVNNLFIGLSNVSVVALLQNYLFTIL
ncbi:Rab-GTPase-TBC domain [Plasmopara halstedii]|uniref:Rab-GTPase-TBC domain n=1 Tax=Plasmopara halstedii TaxID=4781 RepID=A0A0P1A9J5_PLAHL|nr:Rab-GTPase-TBC domain [Plasmopara halstedii]CEG37282.1 Rab-GTPase-TBC domain [Plasmopara halstedii]|eukprot:XP_024573651.1 Rab-GTPase-TBC domain [Plasmopara halstedii]